MTHKKLAAAAILISFFALCLPLSSAVLQPATEVPVVELHRGESTVINLVYFSDRDFLTYLQFSASGDGYGLLSFSPSVPLPANGVVYLPVNVSVPADFAGPSDMAPKIKAVQLQSVGSSAGQIIDSKERTVGIAVRDGAASSSSTETSSSTATESSGASNGTSSASNAAETETPATSTSATTSADSTTTDAGSISPAPTGASVNATPPRSAIIVFPETSADARADQERKAARYIDNLKAEARSKSAGIATRHEFEIPGPSSDSGSPSGVVGVGIDFRGGVSNVSVVVNTLGIEGETTASGVVSSQVEIKGVEDSAGRDIEIGSAVIPDVQRRVVSEEVVRTTPAGEVVRKITKSKAYKYLEVELEGAQGSDVERAEIEFVVERSWMEENGFSAGQVRLNRLVGSDWVELETSLRSEGADVYTFAAQSPGFSFFVITAAITADISTPISVEIPQIEEETGEQDLAADILGTSKPQPLVVLNFSWTLVVIVLGIVVVWKWNDIKRAMGFVHAKENRVKELEAERARYERMKEDMTKKYYKRVIGETEFNNLVMEYDKNIIRIDAELQDLGRKPDKDGKK